MGFVEAEREQVYGQIAITGPSGSGKTVGALKLAYGMTGDWKKIGVADTEHDRSKVYVNTIHTGGEQIGKFMHMRLDPPYRPAVFATAVDEAVKAGLEVLIIDSFSHEWEGLGGVLDWKNELGEGYTFWKEPKKGHSDLIFKIMNAPIHVIVTIRTKQEYAVIPGGGKNGKSSVEKLGMKPVQSGDIDYEFLLSFTTDMDNIATTTKDNTGLFKGMQQTLTSDHGRMLKEWLIEGKEVESVESQNKAKEERRQELIDQFTQHRNSSDKWQSFYTNQEIKTGKNIPEWPLEWLENQLKQLKELKEAAARKQQQQQAQQSQEPKQEEPAPTPPPEEPKVEDTDKVSKVLRYIAYDPKVEKVANEFMTKMKIESVQSCKPEQLEMLLKLTERRAKTVEKERTTA